MTVTYRPLREWFGRYNVDIGKTVKYFSPPTHLCTIHVARDQHTISERDESVGSAGGISELLPKGETARWGGAMHSNSGVELQSRSRVQD